MVADRGGGGSCPSAFAAVLALPCGLDGHAIRPIAGLVETAHGRLRIEAALAPPVTAGPSARAMRSTAKARQARQ
jgi:hypothetical protein